MSEPASDQSPRSPSADQPALNPAALPVADAARVLTRLRGSGRPITEAMLRADIGAGAPTNADGSLNLIHYAAWLVKQLAAGGCAARGPAPNPALGIDIADAPGDEAHSTGPVTPPPDREHGGED